MKKSISRLALSLATLFLMLCFASCTNVASPSSSSSALPVQSVPPSQPVPSAKTSSLVEQPPVGDDFLFLGSWHNFSESDGGSIYEILLEENGSVVLTSGVIEGGYENFSGTYSIENGMVSYEIISDYDVYLSFPETSNDLSAAIANTRHFSGSFQLTVVDDTHIQLTGTYLSGQIDTLFEKGSYLESIGKPPPVPSSYSAAP